nr:MAG: oligopeptide transporter, OPT family protein [Bacteroidota bacterium]
MADRIGQEASRDTSPAFRPYIGAEVHISEFTLRAVLLGAFFGIVFGAATVYLGLKVGLTVSASIPIAVLAISILKRLGRPTILENNIVQTIGSAGESIAAGVVFTLPALLFLPYGEAYFRYGQIFFLALAGGILGVLFMVPLRRYLIVREHGNLPYPEGTACADVLIAGERGGEMARKVFAGLGMGFLYKSLMSIFGLWKEVPQYVTGPRSAYPNATVQAEIVPELLGVGYIIGPRIAGVMVAGGVLAWMGLIPLISLLGSALENVIPPGGKLIRDMTPREIWSNYIRYIGAGAVTLGGAATLIRTLPTIIGAFRESYRDLMRSGAAGSASAMQMRTERDIPITYVVLGSLVLVFLIAAITYLSPSGEARFPLGASLLSSVLIVLFGFFFVTVSSRIVGLIGSSSNPISGMTIATLMATSLLFVAIGWTRDVYQPVALIVGSIVCIAAANAGNTSQDLKTGFLVGATPLYQQLGLIIGVLVSAIVIGGTLLLLHANLQVGSDALPAPQATLMATVIKGLIGQDLPWGFVIAGMVIALVMELAGVRSLPFAVGAYLPLSTTMPIFLGGLLRGYVDRKTGTDGETELGPGVLYSSGLIAGGALTGILIALLRGWEWEPGRSLLDVLNLGERYGITARMGAAADALALGIFLLLAYLLLRQARSGRNG